MNRGVFAIFCYILKQDSTVLEEKTETICLKCWNKVYNISRKECLDIIGIIPFCPVYKTITKISFLARNIHKMSQWPSIRRILNKY